MVWQKIYPNIPTKSKRSNNFLEDRIREVSNEAVELVKYWNGMENTVTHSLHSKQVITAMKYLDRAYLHKAENKPLVIKRIKNAIFLFNILVGDKVIEAGRFKFSLHEFLLGNPHRKPPTTSYHKLLRNKKKLQHFLDLRGTITQYKNTEKRIKEIYAKSVLGLCPHKLDFSFTKKQEEQFNMAARRLVRFMRDNTKLDFLDYQYGATVDDFVMTLISSLKEHYWKKFSQSKIEIGTLCSNYTYTVIFPQYIERMRSK